MTSETLSKTGQFTARFDSRAEAERKAAQLTALGVSPMNITVRYCANATDCQPPQPQIGAGMIAGAGMGILLGGLLGAIFSQPEQTLSVSGRVFIGEAAGAIGGVGGGLLIGIVLGVWVGLLARNGIALSVRGFDERVADETCLEAIVPPALADKVAATIHRG